MKGIKKPVKYQGVSLPVPLIKEIEEHVINSNYRSIGEFVRASVREKMERDNIHSFQPGEREEIAASFNVSPEKVVMKNGYILVNNEKCIDELITRRLQGITAAINVMSEQLKKIVDVG